MNLDNNNNNERATLVSLLTERGITSADTIADAVDDVEGAIATVAYWDDQPGDKGSGLLVWLIREGNHGGYRRAGDRGKPPPRTITTAVERAIRGSCSSPNGFTRDEARDMFAAKAKHLGMSADSLIDHVMGSEWRETPPHAAFDRSLPTEMRQRAYERLLGGRGGAKPGSAGDGERGPVGESPDQAGTQNGGDPLV